MTPMTPEGIGARVAELERFRGRAEDWRGSDHDTLVRLESSLMSLLSQVGSDRSRDDLERRERRIELDKSLSDIQGRLIDLDRSVRCVNAKLPQVEKLASSARRWGKTASAAFATATTSLIVSLVLTVTGKIG